MVSRLRDVFETPFEIKTLTPCGAFQGYASTFDVDTHQDQIMPGAFTFSLDQWKKKHKYPLLLWHHRLEEPIGFWTKMEEDSRGLWVEGQLIMDLPRAKEAYMLMKSGVLEGLSIGFQPVVSRYDSQHKVRKIYQVNLVEISVVSLPANPAAQVQVIKQFFRKDDPFVFHNGWVAG